MNSFKWSIKVKELRCYLCLTQQEFAKRFGVSFVTVNRWENAHFEPTMKQKRELMKMLKKNNLLEE